MSIFAKLFISKITKTRAKNVTFLKKKLDKIGKHLACFWEIFFSLG